MGDVAKLTLGDTIVAFVDVLEDIEGESLKETLEVESTPAAVFIKDRVVTHFPRKPHWKAADFTEFLAADDHSKEV